MLLASMVYNLSEFHILKDAYSNRNALQVSLRLLTGLT